MDTFILTGINQDQPLTRADVEKMLEQVGDSAKLVLRDANMQKIELNGMNLSGADLSGANLSGADLSGANLSGADLSGANLSNFISGIISFSIQFQGEPIQYINLRRNRTKPGEEKSFVESLTNAIAILDSLKLLLSNWNNKPTPPYAIITEYHSLKPLSGADLSRADLSGADLSWANLSNANLSGANLSGTNLIGATIADVNLYAAKLDVNELIRSQLKTVASMLDNLEKENSYILNLEALNNSPKPSSDPSDFNFKTWVKSVSKRFPLYSTGKIKSFAVNPNDNTLIIKFTILEEPFTAQNFATLINSFTDFHTKLWLIARNRFGDLIDFSQTHNPRFVREANLTIGRMSHNSPGEIELKVDISPKGVADGINSLADGIGMYVTNKNAKNVDIEKKRAEVEVLKSQTEITEKKADSGLATEALDRRVKGDDAEQNLLDREQARSWAKREADLKEREKIAEIRIKEAEAGKAEVDLDKYRFIAAAEMAQKLAEINPAYKDVITHALMPSIASMLGVTGLQVEVIKPPQLPAPDDSEPQGS